jgi:hypothetical protein
LHFFAFYAGNTMTLIFFHENFWRGWKYRKIAKKLFSTYLNFSIAINYFLLLLIIVSSVCSRKYCGNTLVKKLSDACTNVDCEMLQKDLNKTNFLYDGKFYMVSLKFVYTLINFMRIFFMAENFSQKVMFYKVVRRDLRNELFRTSL